MTQLKMLTADDKLAEIRRLYFAATRQTIQKDLEKALDILKSMATEDERERATVFMEGLMEMRSDWLRESRPGGAAAGRPRPPKAGGTPKTKPKAPAKPRKPR